MRKPMEGATDSRANHRRTNRAANRAAANIAGIYLTLSVLWIYTSDRLLAAFVADPARLTATQTWKGWLFVLATSALIFVLVSHALTAVHAAKALARRFSDQLLHYLTVSPVITYALQIEGSAIHPVWVSDNVTELLGYTVSETLEKGWWRKHLHPDDRHRAQAQFVSLLTNGTLVHEYRFHRKDGSEIWVHDMLRLFPDADGRPHQVVGAWTDITERKRAEEALKRGTHLSKVLLDAFPYPALLLRPRSREVVAANRAAAKAGAVPGTTCFSTWGQREVSCPWCLAPALWETGSAQHLEVEVLDIVWDAYWIPVTDDLYMHFALEITDRKRVEDKIRQLNAELEERVQQRTAELEATNKELEAFSYSVSHDLRAPLRAIDGFTRILFAEHAEQLDTEGRRVCGVISDNTRRMGQLIDDLLAFSRLGRVNLFPAPLDMTALANEAFLELTTPQERERIDFRLDPLPPAVGDPALLRQVWVNLFGNAVKFSAKKERASIEVGAGQRNSEVVYSVRDNGVGFDMRYADKLFGVFQRLHNARDFEGTGVGLALVQRIIQRHGGRVWAEGSPGAGAAFHFTLGHGDERP